MICDNCYYAKVIVHEKNKEEDFPTVQCRSAGDIIDYDLEGCSAYLGQSQGGINYYK